MICIDFFPYKLTIHRLMRIYIDFLKPFVV